MDSISFRNTNRRGPLGSAPPLRGIVINSQPTPIIITSVRNFTHNLSDAGAPKFSYNLLRSFWPMSTPVYAKYHNNRSKIKRRSHGDGLKKKAQRSISPVTCHVPKINHGIPMGLSHTENSS